jgi:apolipoprotein N-acyltransferase
MESGKPMVRAANTGWTASIDAAGQVVARAPRLAAGAIEVSVQPRAGVTPYIRFGDALPMGIAMIMLVMAAFSEFSDRVERQIGVVT